MLKDQDDVPSEKRNRCTGDCQSHLSLTTPSPAGSSLPGRGGGWEHITVLLL